MDIEVRLDKEFSKRLIKLVRHNDEVAIVKDALSVYMWYLEEKEKDRLVISVDRDGKNVKRLVL